MSLRKAAQERNLMAEAPRMVTVLQQTGRMMRWRVTRAAPRKGAPTVTMMASLCPGLQQRSMA